MKVKALTSDSTNFHDVKEVEVKAFSSFSDIRNHTEWYCKEHMKDRLLNYCNQDTLVDVVMMMEIKSLKFEKVILSNKDCKCCKEMAEYRIDKID